MAPRQRTALITVAGSHLKIKPITNSALLEGSRSWEPANCKIFRPINPGFWFKLAAIYSSLGPQLWNDRFFMSFNIYDFQVVSLESLYACQINQDRNLIRFMTTHVYSFVPLALR